MPAPYFIPADWAIMRAALQAFVASALPAYSTCWAQQDAPAPAFPYAAVRLLAPPVGVGSAETLGVAPLVAQVDRVTLAGAADGTYTIPVNTELATFVALANTAAQIRDGLIAAVNALVGLGAPVTASIGSATSLLITANVPGVAFTIGVLVGPASALTWSAVVTGLLERMEQDADFTIAVQLHARLANTDGRSAAEVRETGVDAVLVNLAAQRSTPLLALERAGLVVREIIGPRDLTGIGGARHESRTVVELRMGARIRSDEVAEWFNTLEITNTIAGDSFTGQVGS